MDHQDWTVYLTKGPAKRQKDTKIPHKEKSKAVKIEEKVEKSELKHKKIDIKLAKEIQQKRLNKKMSQKELAKRLSVTPQIINQIETGSAIYNGQLISRINRLLK
jgi:putative transcription factor